MADTIWELLNSAASSGAVWLSIVLVLALLGELGLPFTCPAIEGLLVFTGFQLAHGSPFLAVVPFLAAAFLGRFLGSTSAYEVSAKYGATLVTRNWARLRLTPERVALLRDRLAQWIVPTVVLARFTPGFTVLTSFLCGVSRVDRKRFLAATSGQIVAWEAAFMTAGAMGGAASRSIDPSAYPGIVAIVIGVAISVSVIVGYVVLRKALQRAPPARTAATSTRVSHAP
ncbi:MAG: hypothetical protein M0R22_01675 [Dehalococcoidia bacterium]|nr:hypothetical protein [Dehalococcoidia bacterium]